MPKSVLGHLLFFNVCFGWLSGCGHRAGSRAIGQCDEEQERIGIGLVVTARRGVGE
jgi:hypothetical protein